MKAICVRQPWASLIASGEKRIETRTWRTKYRGDLLVVACKRPHIEQLPAGQAIAIVRLVDCRQMTKPDERLACCEMYDGAYAWVLDNIRPISPFPAKGQLGIFKIKGKGTIYSTLEKCEIF